MCCCFSHVRLFATLYTVAHQALLSVGFSRLEYWNGLLCPPPRDLPDPGIESTSLMSPALADGFFTTSITWEAKINFQSNHSVMSDSLQPHGLQHTRLPCPSPTRGACSNSCPSSWWCHPTISSFVVPFSSCLQSLLALEPFPVSQFFSSGGKGLEFQFQHQFFQWIFRTDFLQNWDWLDLEVQGTFKSLLQHHSSKASIILALSFLYSPTLTSIHDYWKTHSFD